MTATTLTSAKAGERVRLKTPSFAPTWATQRASAGALSASEIVLLGTR